MKSSRLLWGSVGTAALLATLLFVFGLVYAINDILFPRLPESEAAPQQQPVQTNEPLAQDRVQIVTLGDSLTKGTGDTTGLGYVGNVRQLLQDSLKKPVNVIGNYGVNGYRTDQLLHDITGNAGVIDNLKKANVILFTIGGNDLFNAARETQDLTKSLNAAFLYDLLPEPSKRLQQILERLAEINPDASIVYIALYNPFYDLDDTPTKETSLVIQKWNDLAFQVVNKHPNMILVPTADLFRKHIMDYLYSDHFHPNEAGYKRIAERVVQALQ